MQQSVNRIQYYSCSDVPYVQSKLYHIMVTDLHSLLISYIRSRFCKYFYTQFPLLKASSLAQEVHFECERHSCHSHKGAVTGMTGRAELPTPRLEMMSGRQAFVNITEREVDRPPYDIPADDGRIKKQRK